MIVQLDTENADRDLTSQVTVLTHTPNASNPMLCQGMVYFGDGSKNLDGSGGAFELVVTVGGQTVQPSPQVIDFGTEARATAMTASFPVPANAEVVLKATSPNGADTDVDVTAYLYQVDAVDVVAVSGDSTAADNLELACDGTGYNIGGGDVVAASVTAGVDLADDAITSAKFDESTAYPLASADTGATQIARAGTDGDTLETLSDQLDGVSTFDHTTNDVTLANGAHGGAAASITLSDYSDFQGAGGASAADIADAVWDEALSGHVAAGSAGERVGRIPNAAAGGAGGLPTVNASNYVAGIQGTKNTLDDLTDGDATAAAQTTIDGKLDTIAGYLDTEIAAILEDTSTTIPDLISALNDPTAASIATAVWAAVLDDTQTASDLMKLAKAGAVGKVVPFDTGSEDTVGFYFYESDGATLLATATYTKADGTRSVVLT